MFSCHVFYKMKTNDINIVILNVLLKRKEIGDKKEKCSIAKKG